jgi:glycosyltransferase involved in cell wall biosynthesis
MANILHITRTFSEESAIIALAQKYRNGDNIYIYSITGLQELDGNYVMRNNKIFVCMYKVLSKLNTIANKILRINKKRQTHLNILSINLPNYLRQISWDRIHYHWIQAGFTNIRSGLSLSSTLYLHLHDYCLLNYGIPGVENPCSIYTNIGVAVANSIQQRVRKVISDNKEKVILVSHSQKSKQLVERFSNPDTAIINQDIDIPVYFKPKLDGHTNTTNQYLVLLIVNTYEDPYIKGIVDIQDSINSLTNEQRNRIKVLLVGGARVNQKMFTNIKRTIYGKVSRQQMCNLYHLSDYTIIWSPSETYCQVGKESLTAGTPLITHDSIPFEEYGIQSSNNLVSPRHDSKSLTNLIRVALTKKII